MCGEADIFKQTWYGKQTPVVKQLISSPITNAPPSGIEAALVNGMSSKEMMLSSQATFKTRYGYKTSKYRNVRNFVVVEANAAPGTKPEVKGTIVEAE